MKHRERWDELERLPRDPEAKEATWKRIESRLGEPEQRRRPSLWITAAGTAAALIMAILLIGQFPSTEQQTALVEMDRFDEADHAALEPGNDEGADYLLQRYTDTTMASDDADVMDRLLTPLIEDAEPVTEDVAFEPDMHLLAAEEEQEGTLIYLDLTPEASYASPSDSEQVFELPQDYGVEVKQLHELRADLEPASGSIVLKEERDSVFLAQETTDLRVPAGDALRTLHRNLMTIEAEWKHADEAVLLEEAEEVVLGMEMDPANSLNYLHDVAWTEEAFFLQLSDDTVLQYEEEEMIRSWREVKEATGEME